MAIMQQYLSGKQLTDAGNGQFIVTVNNPLDMDYAGMPAKGTLLPTDDMAGQGHAMPPGPITLSVDPLGGLSGRPVGTKAGWQVCKKDGGFLKFATDDAQACRFAVPYFE